MKKFIVTMLAVLSLNIAFASTSVTANKGEKVLLIELENENADVKIILQNKQGETLHKQNVNNSSYKAEFNMEALPDGSYMLKIISDTDQSISTQTYPVDIINDIMLLGEEREDKVFFPALTVNNDEIIINMLSIKRTTAVVAQFVDSKGVTVHTDKFVVDNGSKGRVYSIESLPEGKYSVTLYIDGHQIQKEFTK